jgi:transcriptional regulator with XRE-family HTH domain
MQKEDILKQLGAHIRKLREERNLSQSDLASAIGKDQQSIQRLEAGKINPSFYYLYQIAEGLSVNVVELTNFLAKDK